MTDAATVKISGGEILEIKAGDYSLRTRQDGKGHYLHLKAKVPLCLIEEAADEEATAEISFNLSPRDTFKTDDC